MTETKDCTHTSDLQLPSESVFFLMVAIPIVMMVMIIMVMAPMEMMVMVMVMMMMTKGGITGAKSSGESTF